MKLLDRFKKKEIAKNNNMKKIKLYYEYFNGHCIKYTHLVNTETNKYYILKEYDNGFQQMIESDTSVNTSIYINN